ncbi:MAG: S4 domain-containing protein [Bacteroidales bacterium]|nr:S4 domain-containing protein [Bacteroidales bacterium]MDD4217011.1 S4 domain-containing protein [Bacteroidales bacterium]MDY0141868.1 S4 domain-containing protein [Bacteroidales bacterium]
MIEQVRIDKYLWAVRIFKTRTLASDACKKTRVFVNGTEAKPSRMTRVNDKINIKFPPIIRSFIVTGLLEKRVSASIAVDNIKEITSQQELEKLNLAKNNFVQHERGSGRPTKKDRRQINKFKDTEI